MRLIVVAMILGCLAPYWSQAVADPATGVCTIYDPAAEIDAFTIVNGLAQWHISREYETQWYVLEGANAAAGPWTQIGAMLAPGSTDYAVDISGSGFSLIRLVEVETSGARLIACVQTSTPPPEAELPTPSRAVLVAQLDSLEQAWQTTGGVSAQSTGIKYVIYTPTVFLADVQNYVAHYWETRGGYVPIVVTTDGFPQPPNHDGFRLALKASIASHATNGAKYFHLIGDWNDWREFTDPAVYPTLWVGPWVAIREQQLRDRPPGQPSKDIIPSYVVPDVMPPGDNMAYGTPYWFTDQDYADTNGDQVPDVIVTRWPIANANELVALAYKMQVYNNWPTYAGPYTVSVYVYDVDYHTGSGDGARTSAVADAIIAEIPAGHILSRVNATTYSNIVAWRGAALNNWNSTLPELVISVASLSTRYSPGELAFSAQDLTSNAMPVVVGASCSTGDFARTENLGLPRFHRLITAPYQGPVAWVGPTAGSWQDGNEAIAREVVREMITTPTRPLAESWIEGLQALSLSVPDQHVLETARSYAFLGDPLSPLKQNPGPPTDTGEDAAPTRHVGLIQNRPNPFNPVTRIDFRTTRKGPVTLKVYDIQGRCIRTLVDSSLRAGAHQITWGGEDDHGNQVGSGVYLYQLVAEGASFTRKLTLVK